MIKAITFDLWDTLVRDDTDEPKPTPDGPQTKNAVRRRLLCEALKVDSPAAVEQVTAAYNATDAAFNHVWHKLHVNWTVEERLEIVLAGLGRSLPDADFSRLCEAHGRTELLYPTDVIDGAADMLADLAQDFRLGVVSDATSTPGHGLRELLDHHDLKRYFSAFAFSDEVGRSKPHRSMFESAARQLGVGPGEMLHVGDRDRHDVKGAQGVGMKAILFTATRDDDRDATSADAVCASYDELTAAIRAIAGNAAD